MNTNNAARSGFIARLDARLDAIGERLKKKEIGVPTDLVGGVLFLIFGIAMLFIIPQQISVGKKEVITGRAFPNLLMYVMIACSAALILLQIVKLVRGEPVKITRLNLLTEVRALIIFTIMLVYYFACQWTGNFAVGSCIFALLMLLFFRCKKPSYYAITLGAAVLIWVAFRFGLGVRF